MGLAAVRPTLKNDRLWQAAHDLEGVFLTQLFQAMRSTVPQDEGFLASSSSEDMFSAMLDEMLGKMAAERLEGGMATRCIASSAGASGLQSHQR